MKLTNKQIKEYAQSDFDENEDVILPDNIIGEAIYIGFILFDIITNNSNRKAKFLKLKRQIYFFSKWIKNK
jgi:hypothetical protein